MLSIKAKNKHLPGAAVISISFIGIILVGTLLLMMPFSSARGAFTNPLTALFTATSATCVTGLVVVDTGTYWSIFGQVVILIMIQIGGLGLVTFVSFINFLIRKKPELHSMKVASESVNSSGFYDVKETVRRVIAISFSAEAVGALLLMTSYIPKFGTARGIYFSIYHSITAFCNAGFDIMGMNSPEFSSMTSLSSDPVTIIVVPLLITAGGLGFVVWTDLIEYRKNKRLAFQSKLVLSVTAILVLLGTLLTLITEWDNPETLGRHSFLYKLGNSFFYSVTLRTAGFNTFNIMEMTPVMKIFSILFMFIGVAPGSTGGGVKTTTFAIVILTVTSVITGKNDTIVMGRKIEKDVVYKSLSVMFIFASLIIASAMIIYYINPGISGVDSAFEVTSAISTTGLGMGISAASSVITKLILILIMFIGRLGTVSLSLALAMNSKHQNKSEVYPVGKITIG